MGELKAVNPDSGNDIKKSVAAKLSQAVKQELEKDKLMKRVDSITVDDGMINVRFSLELPRKKEGMDYKSFTKNFTNPEECSEFIWKEFFNDSFSYEED